MNGERPRDFDESKDDQVPGDLQENIKSRSTWLRLLFMLILVFAYWLSRLVVIAVVILQFFHVLFTGDTNDRLKELGQSLATYSWQVVRYLTYNTETRPFPFDQDWPSPRSEPV